MEMGRTTESRTKACQRGQLEIMPARHATITCEIGQKRYAQPFLHHRHQCRQAGGREGSAFAKRYARHARQRMLLQAMPAFQQQQIAALQVRPFNQ
jgi:hypothetical protein